MFSRIQTRLFLLLFLLIALCVGALFVLSESERNVVNVLFGNLEKERVKLFDEYTGSRSRNLKMITELLAESAASGSYSPEESAGIEKTAEENNIDGIWIVRQNASLMVIPLIRQSPTPSIFADTIYVTDLIKQKRFHFFSFNGGHLFELRAAPLKSGGYLFAARLWDKSYIREIENATQSIIEVDTTSLKENPSAYTGRETSGLSVNAISFSRSLLGPEGTPAALLRIHHDSQVIEEFNHSDSKQFIIFFIFLIVVLAAIFVALLRWVSLPLSAISKSLAKEDPVEIAELQNNRTEFGDVALLVQKFFRQKDELVNEISERTHAELLLKEAHEKLEIRVKERTAELAGLNEQLKLEINERRRAEDLLRKLSAHLQEVREDERSRIAREIHDEMGQVLTALKMEVSLISNKLSDTQLQLKEKVAEVIKLIESIFESVQRITYELRPGILDELGLEAAVEWQARELRRAGIDYEIKLPSPPVNLSDEQSIAIFRIFQEAVTNIIRHSKASSVSILFAEENGEAVLCLKDNGRGITDDEISESTSFGIMGMRERAAALKGSFEIRNGNGTEVNIRIPLC